MHPPPGKPKETDLDPMGVPERPLWQFRWFQVALGLLVALALASYIVPAIFDLLYATRSVLVPVLVGLTLAYVLNPVITYLHERLDVPRPLSAAGMVLIVFGGLVALMTWLLPRLYFQTAELIGNLPSYATTAAEKLNIDLEVIGERLQEAAEKALSGQPQPGNGEASTLAERLQQIDVGTVSAAVSHVLDIGSGAVIGVLGFMGYLMVASIIVVFVFYFAVWKWDAFVRWFAPYLPASHKGQIIDLARKMDASVSAFIRGRLIQGLLLGTVMSLGFTFVGVPSPLLLGFIGGVLNLIPYAGAVVWPVAVGLAAVDGTQSDAGLSIGWDLIAPTVVYFGGQALDSYLVEPLVQGKATNLDALSVLLVVLVGGSLAGLLGLLLAIPIAACLKIVWAEVIGPRLRGIAEQS